MREKGEEKMKKFLVGICVWTVVSLAIQPLDLQAQTVKPDTVILISLPVINMNATTEALATVDTTKDQSAWVEFEKQMSDPEKHPAMEDQLMLVINSQSTSEARLRACKLLALIGTDKSLPVLNNLLCYGLQQREASGSDVAAACMALSVSSEPRACEYLREALKKTSPAQTNACVQLIAALGSQRDTESVELLAPLAVVENSNPVVAVAAIRALGKIHTNAALDAITLSLTENVKTDNLEVLQAGYVSIITHISGSISESEEFYSMVYESVYQSRATPDSIRCAAFLGLIRLDKDGGLERIVSLLKDENSTIKPTAIAAIVGLPANVSSKDFAQIYNDLDVEEQSLLVRALAKRSDPYAQNVVATALRSAEPLVQRAAIESAPQMAFSGDLLAGFTAALLQYPEVKSEIIQALMKFPKDDLVDIGIAHSLRKLDSGKIEASEDSLENARSTLIETLGRRGNPIIIEELYDQFSWADSAHSSQIKGCYQALVRVAQPDDFQDLLVALLTIKDDNTRSDCMVYLSQFASRLDDPTAAVAVLGEVLQTEGITPGQVRSIIPLLVACPTPSALGLLVGLQKNADHAIMDSIVTALASWPNVSAWDSLWSIFETTENVTYREQTLGALVEICIEENSKPDDALMLRYHLLFKNAQKDEEKKGILGALAGAACPAALDLALEQWENEAVRPEASVAILRIAEALKESYPEQAQKALERLGN